MNRKSSYFVADIEPTIAVAEAVRWERETAAAQMPPPPVPARVVSNAMDHARTLRSLYLRDLVKSGLQRLFWRPRQEPELSQALARVQRPAKR